MSDQEYKSRIGTVLRGKWTLDRLIGVGGMAAVYAATHKIGRTEAVKLLDPAVAVSEELRARFEQEARAVNSIGHPGTVEIRDIDVTEDGTPFLVMELLRGETLAERILSGKRVSNNTLLGLVDELLDVLAAAHAKGIIHRDIKPENLFIQKDGSLKVLDFGIARMRDGQVRTMAGTMMGTVAYMPPEQIKGLHIDHRVDLFAVGATMFRTIAGRPVHQDTNDWKVGTRMLTEPAPPLASVAPHAPEWVCMIVDRALGFMPGRRYPDSGTMRVDVQAVRDGRKPPYAAERHEAGDSPHVIGRSEPAARVGPPMGSEPPAATSEDSPQARGHSADRAVADRAAGLMPTTKPQLPAFVSRGAPLGSAKPPPGQPKKVVAATAPQMPAFSKGVATRKGGIAKIVAPTAPMMPAFADKGGDEKDEPAVAKAEPAPAQDAPADVEPEPQDAPEPADVEPEPQDAPEPADDEPKPEDAPESADDEPEPEDAPESADDEPEPEDAPEPADGEPEPKDAPDETDDSAEPRAESPEPAADATDEAAERPSGDDAEESDPEADDADRDGIAETGEVEADDDQALEREPEPDDDEPPAEDDDEAADGPDSSEPPDSKDDAPSERAEPARKGSSNWIVVVALLVAVLLVAWWWRHGPRRQPPTPPSGAPSATSSAPPASGAAR